MKMTIATERMRRSRLSLVSGILLVMAGCEADGEPAAPAPDASFSEEVGIGQLQQEVAERVVRVEIDLAAPTAPLIAREVEIEDADEILDQEKIESRIAAVGRDADGSWSLTLELGGLAVGFGASTRFRAEDGTELDLDGFVARVEADLLAGHRPGIEAKRPPPATLQAPDDPTFFATRLRFESGSSHHKLSVNVGDAHLSVLDSPPPDALLGVLGLAIELHVSAGRTEVELEEPDEPDAVEFEGLVESVDAAGGSFVLVGGVIIEVPAGTRIESGDHHGLSSLSEVASALESGALVEAEGEGVRTGPVGSPVVATEVEFEVEDGDEGVDFEAHVASVDVAGGSVTLVTGALVKVSGTTGIEPGDYQDLQSVADALMAGVPVEADGKGWIESAGPPLTIVAEKVKFEKAD